MVRGGEKNPQLAPHLEVECEECVLSLPWGASCEWVDGGNGVLVMQKKRTYVSTFFIKEDLWTFLGGSGGGRLVGPNPRGWACKDSQESKERRKGKSFGANPKPIAMIHTNWIGESGGARKWNSRICFVH